MFQVPITGFFKLINKRSLLTHHKKILIKLKTSSIKIMMVQTIVTRRLIKTHGELIVQLEVIITQELLLQHRGQWLGKNKEMKIIIII